MKKSYDGLEYIRIPIASTDILTGSLDTCYQNVQNVMENNVCVSQTPDAAYCSDYSHTRTTEWIMPHAPGTEFTC